MNGPVRDPTPRAEPTASVVIPCYNQGHFLGEAIHSALHQTHPGVEVVVVDDGSTDGTRAVAEWAGWDRPVRYVWQRNAGLSAARNAGLRVSTGAYVAFLDSDDWLLPDAVEHGVEAFQERPESAMVVGHHREVDEVGEGPDADLEAAHTYLARRREEAEGGAYEALLRGNYIGMPATVLYRRDALEAVGGFDPSLRSCEDYDLYLRIARRYPVHYHPAVVALYRKHGGGMSRNLDRMLQTSLTVLRRQRAHVRGSTAYTRAWEEGAEFWKGYYGGRLARDLAAFGRGEGGAWWGAVRGAAALARYAPDLLWDHKAMLPTLLFRSPEGAAAGLRRLARRLRGRP